MGDAALIDRVVGYLRWVQHLAIGDARAAMTNMVAYDGGRRLRTRA